MMVPMGEAGVDPVDAAPAVPRPATELAGDPAEPAPEDEPWDFEELYRREYAAMLRVAFLLTDSNELAEEAVHDAFAKVYERRTRLDRPGGYLRTCVINRCRDLQRRRRFERNRWETTASTSSELGADEIVDALAKLPMRQRAALVLRYYEDLSEADIAETLGVRPGTVKSLLSRGLDQLREVIER
jgi:RNA polymerase sigma-70 factor (sigma-E family)